MDVTTRPVLFRVPCDGPAPSPRPQSDDSLPTDPTLVPSTVWFGASVPDSLEREFMEFLGAHNGVAVLTWPHGMAYVDHLARVGLPRLVLVPPGERPPADDPLQDWLPVGAPQTAIHARLLALSRAADARRAAAGPPILDDDGLLHVGDSCVLVPAFERALAEQLVANFERPVAAVELPGPSDSVAPPSLSTRVRRLASRLSPLALEIVAVPGDRYVLRRCVRPASAPIARPTVSAPAVSTHDDGPRTVARRRTLPPHFRSGLLAPESPWSALENGFSLRALQRR